MLSYRHDGEKVRIKMLKQKVRRSVMCYGYDTDTGYRETWGKPATKKELKEWNGQLVYQDIRAYEMSLEAFILNAHEITEEGYPDED